MLSFREYKEVQEKLLNENLGGDIPIGLRQPNTIANIQSKWEEMGMKMSMPMMMKKKGKKWMDPAVDDEENLEVDTDVDMETPGDDVEIDDEEDLEDDDMDDDEDDMDDEEDVEVDDEEDVEEPNPMLNKLKSLTQGATDAKMMHKGTKRMGKWKEGKEAECPCGKDCDCDKDCECYKNHKKNNCDYCGKVNNKESKKCSKCGKMMKKKMSMAGMKMSKKEHKDFLNNLKAMTGQSYFHINPDGTWNEDAILAPQDPNEDISQEPKPGEPGFAPQGKVGSSWENGFDTFAEWVKKSNRKK